MDSVVVLPAPFGPTIPKKEPAGTSRLMPSTAILLPKRLASPLIDRAVAGMLMDSPYPRPAAGGILRKE